MSYGNPVNAINYLKEGAQLLFQPGLRRFVIVPLIINVLVFVAVTVLLASTYGDILHDAAIGSDWLRFIAWLLWIIIGLVVLVLYGYAFNLITTVIAAPFYGILAEKIEMQITGKALPSEPIAKLITRTFKRELVKLWYFISRGIFVLFALVVMFFVPLLNFLTLPLSGLWAAWCMTVQYTDYAADNHQVSFQKMRARLRDKPMTSYSLGGLIMLGSMVPVLNIFVMPVAVAGATLYWLKESAGSQSNDLPATQERITRAK